MWCRRPSVQNGAGPHHDGRTFLVGQFAAGFVGGMLCR